MWLMEVNYYAAIPFIMRLLNTIYRPRLHALQVLDTPSSGWFGYPTDRVYVIVCSVWSAQ